MEVQQMVGDIRLDDLGSIQPVKLNLKLSKTVLIEL